MKKRLSCLLLSILMVALCFTGCAEKTDAEVLEKIGEESSKGAVTLSMYLMSEAPVSEEQELAMEAAVNAITEKEFKVRMDLRYFTADEYYTRLDADLAEMTAFYDGEGIGQQNYEPVYTDEDGLPVTFYPPIDDFEVDIFYFGGYDKYLEYKNAGYIRDMTTEINGNAKSLKAVINTNLFSQVKAINGCYDIVPVNRAIGDYTYILLNKEVLKGTQYAASDITSLVDEDCQDLLSLVGKIYGNTYVPLKSYTGELDVLNVKYFGVDSDGFLTDDFSLIAGTYDTAWKYGTAGAYPEMSDILSTKDNGNLSVIDQINVLKGYEFAGYYGTEEDADKPFAVGYIKGGPEVVEEYSDDYEVIPVGMPTLTTDDIYEHVFAISEDTNSVLKSSEILAYLNTNEEFRNLILYGIENENYVWVDAVDENGTPILDENGMPYRVVSRLTEKDELNYVMDVYKTGNATIAYPSEGTDPRANEYALAQNQDIVIDYTIGFNLYKASFTTLKQEVDLTALKAVSVASQEIYEKILAADTQKKLDEVIAEIETLVASDDVLNVLDMPGLEKEEPETDEAPEGETPEGEVPEGEVPEGEAPEGDAAEGDAVEGDVAEGDAPAADEEKTEDNKVYTSVAAYYDEWLTSKGLKVVEEAPAA